MTESAATFIFCANCGHRRSAFLALRDAGLLTAPTRPSSEELRPLLARFKCSECGLRAIEIDAAADKAGQHFFATSASDARIFHRSGCRFMRAVPADSEVNFNSRAAATSRGYEPCKICRP